MRLVKTITLLWAIAAPALVANPIETAACSKQPSDLVQFAQTPYSNGVPFALAKQFSPCHWVVSTAKDMLDTQQRTPIPGVENVVLTLGIVGKLEAIPVLIEFLKGSEGSHDGVLSYEGYMARANVPIALGCLLNQINMDLNAPDGTRVNAESREKLQAARQEILRFMVEGLVDSRSWDRRLGWRSAYDATAFDRNVYFVKKTVQGLALSGDTAAECILMWTQRHLQDSRNFNAAPQCGVTLPADARHWGQDGLNERDRAQLLRLSQEGVTTCRQVRSYATGLLEYYGK